MGNDIRSTVRDRYGRIAREADGCCGSKESVTNSCCSSGEDALTSTSSRNLGYSQEVLAAIPVNADLGLGCGNPTAIASIEPGETVVDLGSGGGIDCFIAGRRVGPEGHVIGVDMTPDMIDRARRSAEESQAANVEFRLGEIEHLPVADNMATAVISNCVINLSSDKKAVFKEAYRVLKPGGRMMISDIVLLNPLSEKLQSSLDLYVGCVAGAMEKDAYLDLIREAGFTDVEATKEKPAGSILNRDDPEAASIIRSNNLDEDDIRRLTEDVVSIDVLAVKSSADVVA